MRLLAKKPITNATWIPTGVSFVILLVLVLQYPLQTTFPIGGDHTRYAAQAEHVLKDPAVLAHVSDYPATIALIAVGRLLPGDWPTHLTWWIVIAHIAAGIALTCFAHRLAGGWGAAVSLFFWGLTVTGPTRHIEDATLAQLMSLTPLLLSFLAWSNRKIWLALVLLGLTYLFHPFSGLIGVATVVSSLPFLLTSPTLSLQRRHWWWFPAGVLMIGLIIIFRTRFNFLSATLPPQTSEIYLIDFLRSRFGPLIVTAPLGFFLLVRRYQVDVRAVSIVVMFTVISILLVFNDQLHVMLYAHRFVSYFLMALILLASVAIPTILSASVAPRSLIASIIVCLCLSFALDAWASSTRVFTFYETPEKYARLHPDEKTAIEWLAHNVPKTSIITSTTENRHSEWIPLLTNLTWQRVPTFSDIEQLAPHATHVVVFTHREEPPEETIGSIVYRNQGAIVIERQP